LLNASTEHEFETVFAKIAELHVGGLVINSDSFFFVQKSLLLWLGKTRYWRFSHFSSHRKTCCSGWAKQGTGDFRLP
jgi:hypothetical protein